MKQQKQKHNVMTKRHMTCRHNIINRNKNWHDNCNNIYTPIKKQKT